MNNNFWYGILPGRKSNQSVFAHTGFTLIVTYFCAVIVSSMLYFLFRPLGAIATFFTTIIFVVLGLACVFKRLSYLQWNKLWFLLLFLPVVNLLFIAILFAMPDN